MSAYGQLWAFLAAVGTVFVDWDGGKLELNNPAGDRWVVIAPAR